MGRCRIREWRTGLTEYRSPFSRGKEKEEHFCSHGKGHICLCSGKTAGGTRTKPQVFLGNISWDFGVAKPISGCTTEAPWQQWFVSRDRTPFLQTVVIKIALLDLCVFAVTGRTAHSSSSFLRKGCTCCVDWLKLTGDRARFNTHLRASLHKLNEKYSLKTCFRVEIYRGRAQTRKPLHCWDGSSVVTV